MSQQLISRRADLGRLRAEGYTLAIRGAMLVVSDVPFVDDARVVHEDGALVMPITLPGEPPPDHTAYFAAGVPCDSQGNHLVKIINNTNPHDLGDGLAASCYFSAKPYGKGNYDDYYDKVTTYIGHIAGPAAALRPEVTAKRFRPVRPDDGAESPFRYLNTASSRAAIDAITEKLEGERLAIVGSGGTGSYILDLVAKTPVAEIHVFDDDPFYSHNAFRAPGAPSLEQLEEGRLKVERFAELYGSMHAGIVPHPYRLDASNVDELRTMTFVFIAIDDAPAKKPIVAALDEFGIPFIDVGMGVQDVDGRLTGLVRTTFSTPERRGHVPDRVSFVETGLDDDYRSNIQIAELNALNASLAVIRWKKHKGFYADLGGEFNTTYGIATNALINEDQL